MQTLDDFMPDSPDASGGGDLEVLRLSETPALLGQGCELFVAQLGGGEHRVIATAKGIVSTISVQAEPFAADALAKGCAQRIRVGVDGCECRYLIENLPGGEAVHVAGQAFADHDRCSGSNQGSSSPSPRGL